MPNKDTRVRTEYSRRYYRENREKRLLARKTYRLKNPDKVKALNKKHWDTPRHKEQTRLWRLQHPDAVERTRIKQKLKRKGLNPESYEALIIKQNGCCALCKKPFTKENKTCIDHDHACCPGKTSCGKCIRSLLHMKCNFLIGHADEDPEMCILASNYLKKWKTKGESWLDQL